METKAVSKRVSVTGVVTENSLVRVFERDSQGRVMELRGRDRLDSGVLGRFDEAVKG